jgi:RNA polymerase sigma-70 factor (ECF subfamily)
MLTEQELLKGCQQKDPKAQTAFYNRYRGKLMGVCKRYAKSEEDAEDIFQDAFVKIFKNIDSIQKIEAVNSWVKQIVVNTAINHYHANLKFKQNTDYEDVVVSNDDHLEIISSMGSEYLLEVINDLPDGYRMVFNMYVIDGYNHLEIGEKLGISENTSKSQLSRAKDSLRKKLKVIGVESYER